MIPHMEGEVSCADRNEDTHYNIWEITKRIAFLQGREDMLLFLFLQLRYILLSFKNSNKGKKSNRFIRTLPVAS